MQKNSKYDIKITVVNEYFLKDKEWLNLKIADPKLDATEQRERLDHYVTMVRQNLTKEGCLNMALNSTNADDYPKANQRAFVKLINENILHDDIINELIRDSEWEVRFFFYIEKQFKKLKKWIKNLKK